MSKIYCAVLIFYRIVQQFYVQLWKSFPYPTNETPANRMQMQGHSIHRDGRTVGGVPVNLNGEGILIIAEQTCSFEKLEIFTATYRIFNEKFFFDTN